MRINMSEQIMSLTLTIVGESLFGANVESDTQSLDCPAMILRSDRPMEMKRRGVIYRRSRVTKST